MSKSFNTRGRIVVVDEDPASYGPLLEAVAHAQQSLYFVPTGRAALRLPRQSDDRLWIINAELPDISAFALLEMLQERLHRVPVIVLGDCYRVEDELRACRSGAALYLCKPLLDMTSLNAWVGECQSAKAIKAGPGRGGTLWG